MKTKPWIRNIPISNFFSASAVYHITKHSNDSEAPSMPTERKMTCGMNTEQTKTVSKQ
jgi:hypothetical protein